MKPYPKILRPVLCLAVAAAMLLPAKIAAETGEVIRHKLVIKSFLDFGHLISGTNPYYQTAGEKSPELSMLPLNRANVTAIQEVAVDRFDVSVGLSGLIWWPYGGGLTDADQRVMLVKPMIPVARARWQFGDPTSLSGAFQIGTFNYKYNPDAKNLGEYLYRAGTYPGFLWSNEGWLLMNRAGNYSHGALLSLAHFNGKLKHNFSLFMETQYYPIGDFSPGYDFSFTSKWIELGGGAVFNHYLPLRPSALKPKESQNTYVRVATSDSTDYYGPMDQSPVYVNPTDTALDWEILHRWTHKGIKLMGRGTVNLGHLLPEQMRGPEDLRIFAEAAVLGVKNQPLYYEKLSERIPVMFGINIPTFKILDVLSIQGEYYKSRFNDIELYNTKSLPVWQANIVDSTGNVVVLMDPTGKIILKSVDKDDMKWSIYAKKTVNKVMAIHAQAASDHFRLTDGKFKASSVPLTASLSEWYYLFRLEFSLR